MTPPVRTVSAEIRETVAGNSTKIALLQQEVQTVKDRDAECRNGQHESWQKQEARMTALEKAVTTTNGNLDRLIEAQAQAAAASTSDKDREVKVVDSKRGHLTAITCALISVVGALLVGYMSWAAKAASADLPAVVSAAVAEGVKQALAAH